MCGIFGVIAKKGRFSSSQIENALEQLKHRGPDDYGIEKFVLPENDWEVFFGHRRLSTIDLSPLGHQPMSFKKDNNIESIIFNGEIYNHKELKNELVFQQNFKSHGDTEVLLAGLVLHGKNFITKLNGMFAFAYYSSAKKRILLGRDRLGKKPLYIYRAKNVIAFASELKAFVTLGLPLTLSDEGLSYYRWVGYVPAHMTIYKECQKLLAATSLEINFEDSGILLESVDNYWDPFHAYGQKTKLSYNDAVDHFLELLDDATKIRLEADVPVGVFLSGGIDSSLVTTSAKKVHGQVKAFTVKFSDSSFDESQVAIETAQQLGVDLHVLHLESHDFDRQMCKVSHYYDEPFSDSSQIPTMAIAEKAREHVTVVLTGDGGDEVFLGYPRYGYTQKLHKIQRCTRMLPFIKAIAPVFLKSSMGRFLFLKLAAFLGVDGRNLDSKIDRAISLLSAKSAYAIYDDILAVATLKKPANIDSYFSQVKSFYPHYNWHAVEQRSFSEQLAALDLITYMKDDVLVKVDRATMAYSLEARSPLLDYRIVEFGTSLPFEYKVQGGVYKKILREALQRRVPGGLSSLPKKGFGVPLLADKLPPAPTLTEGWNKFVESMWFEKYIQCTKK